jgi:hypothetical protein
MPQLRHLRPNAHHQTTGQARDDDRGPVARICGEGEGIKPPPSPARSFGCDRLRRRPRDDCNGRGPGVCRRAIESHNAPGQRKRSSVTCAIDFQATDLPGVVGLFSLISTYVPPRPAVGGPKAGVGGPETAPQRRLAGATAGFEPATGSRGDRDSSTPQRRLRRFVSGRVSGLTDFIGQTSAGWGGVSSTNGCLSNLTSGKPPASRDGPDDCCLPSREQRVAQRAGDCRPRRGAAVWTCAPARGPRQACRTRRPRRLLASEKRASTARPFTNIRVRPLLSWTMSHRV